MTDNPSRESRARGTILLTLIVGSYAPSGKLFTTLRQFIQDGPPGFKTYLNMLLRRTLENGTVPVFRRSGALEDSIGSHACSLEALACMRSMSLLSEVHSLTGWYGEFVHNTEGTRFEPPCLTF